MGIDPAAVEAYEKHADELLRYACVLVGPSEAEDVVADAMLRVFMSRRWGAVKDSRAYLLRCIFHQAASSRRRQAIGRLKETRSLVPRDPGELRVGDELGVFGALSMRERAVIYATYWDDLTPREVAALLAISEGAVRRYLARARAKLREVLKDE